VLKGVQLTLLMGVVPQRVQREVIDALTSVQVNVGSGQRSGFQLTFTFGKSSIINTRLLPSGFFDTLTRVIIVVTINGQQTPIMDGVITRQELAPNNEPGQSTLSITGEDLSVLMDLIDWTGIIRYPAMPREARVLLMLAKYAAFGIAPKVIPSVLIDVPLPTDTIPGHEGTDYAYINELADFVGYVFYIDPGPTPGLNVAYWGPEIKFGIPQPALTVNSDAHSNVESLSFAFDGMSSSLFIFHVQNNLAVPKIAYPIPLPPITPLNPPLGAKIPPPLKLQMLNRPDEQQEEETGAAGGKDRVRERATARMTPTQAILAALGRVSKSADVVTGSGQLDVLRYGRVLEPRKLVGVRGAGVTYDGLYYVKSVSHTIKRGEYKQSFQLTRNARVAFSQKVAV
jgi:hypothetical protein